MTDTKALDALIEAVENGEWDGSIPDCLDRYWLDILTVYHDHCLNTAKALHYALLPGWSSSVGQNVHHGYWFAHVMKAEDGAITHDCSASSETPARAWLLAILKAYRAQVTE